MLRIEQLIDDAKYYEVVRSLRWPDGVHCRNCNAANIKKHGLHDCYSYRQRYVCQACGQQFEDVSGTVFVRFWKIGQISRSMPFTCTVDSKPILI